MSGAKRKARTNPGILTVFGNPGRKIASDVQAIVYIHAQDKQPYVHGFGGRDPSQAELDDGMLDIAAMPTRTGVEAFWSADRKTVTLRHRDGKPLIGLF